MDRAERRPHHGASHGEMVDAAVAVRIGMIVSELVTNSCKYAYAEGCNGEIRVGFSVSDGRFVMIVADDGRGIQLGTVRIGMGMRLVNDLARRLYAPFPIRLDDQERWPSSADRPTC